MTGVERWEPGTTELVVQADPTENLLSWARAAQAAHELAVPLCETSFVPSHFYNKPGEATAAILYGAEAGLSPLQALQGVYVISGKPAMYARTLMAVVLGAGHEVWTESESESRVIVCGRRRGSQQVEKAIWTIDRAKKAGYTKNAKYQTDPQAMLLARAQSDVCRRVAPDALLGMAYSVEELQDSDVDAPAPAKRTVARKKATPADPTEAWEEPQQDPGERKIVDVDLPPLPNEEPAQAQPVAAEAREEKVGDRIPGSITPRQTRMMMALLNQAGLSDRQDRLDLCQTLTGRGLTTSNDLTKGEAQKVIDHLLAVTGQDVNDPEPGFEDEPHPDEFVQLPYKDD